MYKINIAVIDNIHKGDDANAIGIGEKTLVLFNEKPDFPATLSISEAKDIDNNINILHGNIIIAASEHNLSAITPFKQLSLDLYMKASSSLTLNLAKMALLAPIRDY